MKSAKVSEQNTSSLATKRSCKRVQRDYSTLYRKMSFSLAATYIVCVLTVYFVQLYNISLQGPYFTWSTISGSGETYTRDAEIPRPILDIQEVLLRYLQGYGDAKDTNINHIVIKAWATPGSKRVRYQFSLAFSPFLKSD